MLFQRINRSSAEKVFVAVYNADSTALANGDICTWKTGLTEATGAGLHILQSTTTAAMITVAGVAIGEIKIGAYGIIQVYGIHSAVKTTGTVTAGTHSVITSTTAGTGKASTASGADDTACCIGPCIITASGGRAGVFLRVM